MYIFANSQQMFLLSFLAMILAAHFARVSKGASLRVDLVSQLTLSILASNQLYRALTR